MANKQIIYIDASVLSRAACNRHLYLHAIRGLQQKGQKSYKLGYGSCGHKALENYYRGGTVNESIMLGMELYQQKYAEQIPTDNAFEFRYPDHLFYTLKGYFERYSWDKENLKVYTNEGQHCVEEKFAIPWWSNENYELILCGTIDIRGEYQGQPCIVDHKFTSTKKYNEFFTAFEFAIQPLFYSWFIRYTTGSKVCWPVMINGIFIHAPTKKRKIDTADYKRSAVISYTEEQHEQFDHWLRKKLNTITNELTNNTIYDDFEMASCKFPFGTMCPYFEICKEPRKHHEGLIRNKFNEVEYNPLKFGEE